MKIIKKLIDLEHCKDRKVKKINNDVGLMSKKDEKVLLPKFGRSPAEKEGVSSILHIKGLQYRTSGVNNKKRLRYWCINTVDYKFIDLTPMK